MRCDVVLASRAARAFSARCSFVRDVDHTDQADKNVSERGGKGSNVWSYYGAFAMAYRSRSWRSASLSGGAGGARSSSGVRERP